MFRLIIRITAISIVLSMSCATINVNRKMYRDTNKFKDIDKEIAKYLDDFKLLTGKGSDGLTAGFGDIGKGSGVVGVCFRFSEDSEEIELDKLYWANVSPEARRALVYHEATHCLCGIGHRHKGGTYKEADKEEVPSTSDPKILEEKGYFPDRCAVSIMHPRMQYDWCLTQHWDHYIKDMIESCD